MPWKFEDFRISANDAWQLEFAPFGPRDRWYFSRDSGPIRRLFYLPNGCVGVQCVYARYMLDVREDDSTRWTVTRIDDATVVWGRIGMTNWTFGQNRISYDPFGPLDYFEMPTSAGEILQVQQQAPTAFRVICEREEYALITGGVRELWRLWRLKPALGTLEIIERPSRPSPAWTAPAQNRQRNQPGASRTDAEAQSGLTGLGRANLEDSQTGISLRFVKEYDVRTDPIGSKALAKARAEIMKALREDKSKLSDTKPQVATIGGKRGYFDD